MSRMTVQQMKQTLAGFVGLALGSSKLLIWNEANDSMSYGDGERVYLPLPDGRVEGEFDLLLAMAMREVAKITHTQTSDLVAGTGAPKLSGEFAMAIEDARIKQAIGSKYAGAKSIFGRAASLVAQAAVTADQSSAQQAADVRMAIWAAANAAFLGSAEAQQFATGAGRKAAGAADPIKLATAMGMATAAPWLANSQGSMSCAMRIAAELMQQPQPQQQQPQESPGNGQTADETDSCQVGSGCESNEQSDQDGGEASGDSSDGSGSESGSPAHGDQASNPSDPTVPAGDEGDGARGGSQAQEQPSAQGDAGQGGGQGDQQTGPGGPSGAASDAGAAAHGTTASGESQAIADPLSNTLAQMRGHAAGAKMRPVSQSQAQAQTQATAEASGDLVESLAQALQSESDVWEQVEHACAQWTDVVQGSDSNAEPTANDADFEVGLDATDKGAGIFVEGMDVPVEPVQNCSLGTMPAGMVTALQRALHDKRDRVVRQSTSGRHLNVSRLWELKATGNTRVFLKREETGGTSAAVQVLLDASGSMRDCWKVAVDSTHAFMQALTRITGVQTALSYFPAEPFCVGEVTRFRQNLNVAKQRLSSMAPTGCSTPTGRAIRSLLPSLTKVPTKRHLIVLITDGRPESMTDAIAAVAQARQQGVEVLGVGIGSATGIETITPMCVSVKSVHDLPRELTALLRKDLSNCLLAA